MNPRQALTRVLAGTLALSLVLAIPAVLQPPAAEAACGTEWTSKKEPPPTILVLRTGSGNVAEVNFKRYVAEVMASGEWPTTMNRTMLEVGALAAKQYGWYYTLKGNHREAYRTASGKCYDVRDDSADQIYRPDSAEPTEKQKAARDELWGLSLRKNDKFLLTGYRAGSATKCAADADGWHLYAASAKDCVKRLEYDSEDVLRAYYGPNLKLVWAPGTEPEDAGADDKADDKKAEESTEEEPSEDGDTDEADSGALGGVLDSISGWYQGLWGSSD